MAAKAPGNPAEFRQIHGVGEVKADGYGPAFLKRSVNGAIEGRGSTVSGRV
jgi:superfamily II DNA helicase RecQ